MSWEGRRASADITPSELKAIEDHKYFMSKDQKREVSIDEAIRDFQERYLNDWRREEGKRGNLEQLAEIEKYKFIRSQEAGRDIGDEAVEEWRRKYAAMWRQERESLVRNGFESATVTVKNPHGLHVRPSVKLAGVAREYDCDIYVHKQGMEHFNFKLNGKPFMNVRSVLASLALVQLCAMEGDQLEFIAFGKQAKEALSHIQSWIDAGCQD